MLSLRDFTALANQKLVVLLIPVLSPLWYCNYILLLIVQNCLKAFPIIAMSWRSWIVKLQNPHKTNFLAILIYDKKKFKQRIYTTSKDWWTIKLLNQFYKKSLSLLPQSIYFLIILFERLWFSNANKKWSMILP